MTEKMVGVTQNINMKKLTLNKGKDYLIYREGQNNTTEIFDIAVKSERRAGHGTKLLKLLNRKVNGHIFAFTRESNQVALKFYRNNGFAAYHIPNFYPDEGAYLIIKSI